MWVGGGEGVHSRLCTTKCVFMPQVIVSAHAVSESECCTGGRRWGLCGVCVCVWNGGGGGGGGEGVHSYVCVQLQVLQLHPV